nr:hypothetical protein [Bacillus pumilus]
MSYKVEFSFDEFSKNVIMNIVSNRQIIFHEIVTKDVLRVAEEFKNALKR